MNTNTQSDLTQILDEMGAVTEETKDAAKMQATCVIQHPLLVKAVRMAMVWIDAAKVFPVDKRSIKSQIFVLLNREGVTGIDQ